MPGLTEKALRQNAPCKTGSKAGASRAAPPRPCSAWRIGIP